MKSKSSFSRRDAIKTFSIVSSGLFVAPGMLTGALAAKDKKLPGNSPGILSIGIRNRGLAVALGACKYGKMVVCCDIDTANFSGIRKRIREYQNFAPDYYTDYRAALERKDVDIVTIGTPDHWHAKMLIDAVEAGKDVYVEKPMTLTIAEGIAVCEAVKKSGRVVQVGTQQRSEYDGIFLKAVALTRRGVLGKNVRATVFLPVSTAGKSIREFPVSSPPGSLNWEEWCGPIGELPYCPKRCHGSWRSWVETGHGTLTDWGAHYVDIAQWALGVDHTGPVKITGTGVFPLGNKETLAVITGKKPSTSLPNAFSAVRNYKAELEFKNGKIIRINGQEAPPAYAKHKAGLLLEGENGNIWVSRGGVKYQFVGSLAKEIEHDTNLQQKINEDIIRLYKGKQPTWVETNVIGDIIPTTHMENFISCVKDRTDPVSDVYTHHRANSSAILAHSSMLLNRPLEWNPDKQEFVNDEQADQLLARKYHGPYQL